ncbi:unnamed protein product [Notodromas monacha]|uniref:Uncharacterized protein n=1 Tax=Notodromas monacha TaxID=399045 RepID=A0A7R9BFN0_9CRUS|nr:unnamed protein product [Notodromas monacha]CAG0913619.1 unnamed protein product [Notodromas monacha]
MRPAPLSVHCCSAFARHVISVAGKRTRKMTSGELSACRRVVEKLPVGAYELLLIHFLRWLDVIGVAGEPLINRYPNFTPTDVYSYSSGMIRFAGRSESLEYMFLDRLKMLKAVFKYDWKVVDFVLKQLPLLGSLEALELGVVGRAETELTRLPSHAFEPVQRHLESMKNVKSLALTGGTKLLWDFVTMGIARGSREALLEVKIPSIRLSDTVDTLTDCPNLADLQCEEFNAEGAFVDVKVLDDSTGQESSLKLGFDVDTHAVETADELSLRVRRDTRLDTAQHIIDVANVTRLYLNLYEADSFGVSVILPAVHSASAGTAIVKLTIEDARDCDLGIVMSTCPQLRNVCFISCQLGLWNPDSGFKVGPGRLTDFVLYDCLWSQASLVSFISQATQLETLILVDVCDSMTSTLVPLFSLMGEVQRVNPLIHIGRLKFGDDERDIQRALEICSKFLSLDVLEWEASWSWRTCRNAEETPNFSLAEPVIRLHSNQASFD